MAVDTYGGAPRAPERFVRRATPCPAAMADVVPHDEDGLRARARHQGRTVREATEAQAAEVHDG